MYLWVPLHSHQCISRISTATAAQDVTGRARNVSFDESLGRGVGSTCTLVAEAFLADAPSFLHADVALMLLGVILVDTLNLDPTMNKTTPRDEAAVSALLPVVRSAFPTLYVMIFTDWFSMI